MVNQLAHHDAAFQEWREVWERLFPPAAGSATVAPARFVVDDKYQDEGGRLVRLRYHLTLCDVSVHHLLLALLTDFHILLPYRASSN
jgi:hypothetical protein